MQNPESSCRSINECDFVNDPSRCPDLSCIRQKLPSLPPQNKVIDIQKLEALAKRITDDSINRLCIEKLDCQVNRDNAVAKIVPGKKYVRIDRGGSGFLMITDEGEIYGIKGYGVIHLGNHYGNLDTIHEYFWGYYHPEKVR